jgi:hypothetical protein
MRGCQAIIVIRAVYNPNLSIYYFQEYADKVEKDKLYCLILWLSKL